MPGREPLSVAVITFNEERNVARCLRSVSWADEVVVLDCGSTDRTREIAREAGATVHRAPWAGFVEQKNGAIARTAHEWVLSLDADEWLTDEGAAELRRALVAPRADGYALRRRTSFCGRFLRGAWSPDWQLRLFRRSKGRFAGGPVHESVRMDEGARVARLREPLTHLAYRSVGDYVDRMNRYTGLAAGRLHAEGRRVSVGRMVLAPPLTFLKFWLLKRGFLDGVRGWIVSAGSAYYVLLKYAKLWELGRPVDAGFRSEVPPTPEDPDPGRVEPPRAGEPSGGGRPPGAQS
jgi:glycosyltransferase involved in cell wall biosynthesis